MVYTFGIQWELVSILLNCAKRSNSRFGRSPFFFGLLSQLKEKLDISGKFAVFFNELSHQLSEACELVPFPLICSFIRRGMPPSHTLTLACLAPSIKVSASHDGIRSKVLCEIITKRYYTKDMLSTFAFDC